MPDPFLHFGFRQTLLRAMVILLAGLFVYLPVFHGEWIWDDHQEVTDNEMLWSKSGWSEIWKGDQGADYLPVKTSLQRLFYSWAGDDASRWHLLNIALHLLNAFLVWRLFSALALPRAWLGGLIFAIHPLAVESVAWISEFKNTLSLAFLLFSMLSYIAFQDRRRPVFFAVAFAAYALALLSKSSVVMYPFVILLYVWWRRGRIGFRDILFSVPFFAASLVFGLVTIHFQFTRAINAEVLPAGGIASRAALAGLEILFYFSKCLVPLGLMPGYPRWNVNPPAPIQFLAWPVIFGALLFAWSRRETWGKAALLGLGFFLLNLAPVLGFINMSYMRISWVADHFVYLPMIGVIGLAVWGAGRLSENLAPYRRYLPVVGSAFLFLLLLTSRAYAGVFVNETVLWTYALRNNPDAWHAHSQLSKIQIQSGENEEALYHCREALRLRPDLAGTHNNYAVILQIMGDKAGALDQAREALRLDPTSLDYHCTLALILSEQGRHAEAETLFRQLLAGRPRSALFFSQYAIVLEAGGRFDEAASCLERALALKPGDESILKQLEHVRKKKSSPEKTPGSQTAIRSGN